MAKKVIGTLVGTTGITICYAVTDFDSWSNDGAILTIGIIMAMLGAFIFWD